MTGFAFSRAIDQALALARGDAPGARVGSICVHSDTPGAVAMARAIRQRLLDDHAVAGDVFHDEDEIEVAVADLDEVGRDRHAARQHDDVAPDAGAEGAQVQHRQRGAHQQGQGNPYGDPQDPLSGGCQRFGNRDLER